MSATATLDATDRYTIISADCHAGASMDRYRDYLESKFHDDFDAWRGEYRNPFRDLQADNKRTRNWDNEQRISEMASQGVVAEVVFPNTVPPFFPTSSLIARAPSEADYRQRLAGIHAHNRWLVDWCNEFPERRAGIGQIFLNDVDQAVKDIHFIKENGLRGGVLLPGAPEDSGLAPLHSSEYELIWQTCADLDVVINHHSGSAGPNYGDEPAGGVIWIVETSWFSHRGLWHLIMSGVFERHPSLKFVLTEQGASWVPETLRMLDMMAMGIRAGKMGELGFDADQAIPRAPSEYWAQNCYVGSLIGSMTPEDRAAVGVDKIMWGSDYPHDEGCYPHTLRALGNAFNDVDPVDVTKMLSGNAADVYDFDLDALAPLAAEHGPTVADLSGAAS
ncbi:MAG: amidohydrolase [Acidobacteria bacterium]|nr:amidohydrolase [Acidobacteriota bacterium]